MFELKFPRIISIFKFRNCLTDLINGAHELLHHQVWGGDGDGEVGDHVREQGFSSSGLWDSVDQVDDVDLAEEDVNEEDKANDEQEGCHQSSGVRERNVKKSKPATEKENVKYYQGIKCFHNGRCECLNISISKGLHMWYDDK